MPVQCWAWNSKRICRRTMNNKKVSFIYRVYWVLVVEASLLQHKTVTDCPMQATTSHIAPTWEHHYQPRLPWSILTQNIACYRTRMSHLTLRSGYCIYILHAMCFITTTTGRYTHTLMKVICLIVANDLVISFLSIGPLGTNFSEIQIKIHNYAFMKMHLNMPSKKRRPFCPGGDE